MWIFAHKKHMFVYIKKWNNKCIFINYKYDKLYEEYKILFVINYYMILNNL